MVPLAVHSHYSLGRGTASPGELVRAARKLGYRRVALTDRDNLYGLWPFLEACREAGLIPLVGAEVTDPAARCRAAVLAETAEGYANLCRLLTRRHAGAGFSLETALPPRSSGLAVLTDSPKLLTAWRRAGLTVRAMIPRPLSPKHPLRRAARRWEAPLVAVPPVWLRGPEDHPTHRLLRAIDRNTALSRLSPNDVAPADAWLQPPGAYARRFAACPGALRETRVVADGIDFAGPHFGMVMPPWTDPDGRSAEAVLREAAFAGAVRLYGADLPEPVVDRLAHELSVIAGMGFSTYFLTVRDIVAISPRTCGRGSGAASLVSYCLGITNVCPVRHNLLFERFLNPGRRDPPDIDIDFAWDERDAVIGTVLERFRGHVALVASHIPFQPRMAVRETAKVMGLSDGEIRPVTRRIPWHLRLDEADDLLAAVRALPEARSLRFSDPWPTVFRSARRIIGCPRHLSVHPGGVVITPEPLETYVPVEIAPKGVPVIQWEKDGAETAGLVKIDLLGNRSLGVIRDAVASIRGAGDAFDERGWVPEEDPATRRAVGLGKTMGCFYIESPAMRLLQQKTGRGDFEHLVIHSSIIRPAANDCIREYIRRLHGGAWEPLHPLLEDVLDETYGIMVYQEDVSRSAVALAGFSHVEADRLRKIMAKKERGAHLADFRTRFTDGARRRGVSEATVDAVWEMILSFSGYSFCKPHSASYARVSFQAAYLKVHHPAAFMAAVISNGGGFYSTFAYVSEARRMGLTIRPPDVSRSEVRWTGRDRVIRVGSSAIRDLGARTAERIVDERQQRPFLGVTDFFERVRPDEAEVRGLIAAGALDGLADGTGRAGLAWQHARWRADHRRGGSRQCQLTVAGDPTPPPFPPERPIERLRAEYAALGFLCDRHPMALFAGQCRSGRMIPAARLADYAGRTVRTAGWLITGKRVRTRHHEPMEFLTFEDDTGLVETVFFPATYRRYTHLLEIGRPYELSGRVERSYGATTLNVCRVAPLRRGSGFREGGECGMDDLGGGGLVKSA